MTMHPHRKILVIGATGTVGREVVRALLERGARVSALVRSPERAALLPAGVTPVLGDLGDAAAVTRALAGMDAAFYVSPHEANEEAICRQFVAACERARCRIVFVGTFIDGPNRLVRALLRNLIALKVPHYRPKFRLAERVRRCKADPVVLMASTFFQNDDLTLDEIYAGVLPLPLPASGINRVDARDIGDAAARALLDPDLPSGAYPVAGPAHLTGEDCAAAWSAALGRPVRYAGQDPALWRRLLEERLDGKKRSDFLKTFDALQKFDVPQDPEEIRRTTSLLGRPPRTYADYVRDTLAASPPATAARAS
jgi:uncharacterized protein YbjT (DUF2867 family)